MFHGTNTEIQKYIQDHGNILEKHVRNKDGSHSWEKLMGVFGNIAKRGRCGKTCEHIFK